MCLEHYLKERFNLNADPDQSTIMTPTAHVYLVLAVLLFGLVSGRNVPGVQIEGRDFFYNEAEGRKSSCSDFCDTPTDYEVTCKQRCKYYIPKARAKVADDNLTGRDDKTFNGYISYIVVSGILIVAVVFSLSAFINRSRLKRQFENMHERLCGRLATAQTETGNGPSAPAIYTPVRNQ